MTMLIAYGTVEGQSRKIAAFLEKLATDAGHEVEMLDTSDLVAEVDWETVGGVMLVASVHERRHPKAFEIFVSSNRSELASRSTFLLSVSLRAAFEEGRDDAQDYLDEMKMRTGIEPDLELLVPGAIRSQSYDYFSSQILRHVVLRGQDFDPNVREHEFTDWGAIEEKAGEFLHRIST